MLYYIDTHLTDQQNCTLGNQYEVHQNLTIGDKCRVAYDHYQMASQISATKPFVPTFGKL
jgi:hypothetical protein